MGSMLEDYSEAVQQRASKLISGRPLKTTKSNRKLTNTTPITIESIPLADQSVAHSHSSLDGSKPKQNSNVPVLSVVENAPSTIEPRLEVQPSRASCDAVEQLRSLAKTNKRAIDEPRDISFSQPLSTSIANVVLCLTVAIVIYVLFL